MSETYKDVENIEDFETWRRYGYSNFRWVFNKLELAVRQGLKAGPSATAPDKSGSYIIRPIYNLYGMGLGAQKFDYDLTEHKGAMLNGEIVPPGYFWCEWLAGNQISVDYRRSVDRGNSWVASSIMQGFHKSDKDLTRFAFWEKLNVDEAPPVESFIVKPEFLNESSFTGFNVEFRGGVMTEIHLRLGNDYFDDLPVGSKVYPFWEGSDEPKGEWRDNPPSVIDLSSNDKLSGKRLGFKIQRPEY